MHLRPRRMTFPLCVMVQLIAVKSTSHPALHRVTTEMREKPSRPGMMWPCLHAYDSGKSRLHLWLDLTVSPLGSLTRRPCWTCLISVAGALVTRKLLVAPESRMAYLLMVAVSMVTV